MEQARVEEIYDVLGSKIDSLRKDRAFMSAFKSLDVKAVAKEFNVFQRKITAYNNFHRRERRLWSLKLGKGRIPSKLEKGFIKTIPEGRKNYKDAFAAIDRIAIHLHKAGFDSVLKTTFQRLRLLL